MTDAESDARTQWKLITAGNTSVPPTVNAILAATRQLRSDLGDKAAGFQSIHVFHTRESLHSLLAADAPGGDRWQGMLLEEGVSPTSLVHHTTDLGTPADDQFRTLVNQLAAIVNPLNHTNYYIDLTNGLASLKAILAVFAYVLDIRHIFSLEAQLGEGAARQENAKLFLPELVSKGVRWDYRPFPAIREFDRLSKLNGTDVHRYANEIDGMVEQVRQLLGGRRDLAMLRSNLRAGMTTLLHADINKEIPKYRQALFMSAAGTEEVANILLAELQNREPDDKTLGDKLADLRSEVRDLSKSDYFVDEEVLERLTTLLSSVRNRTVHPKSSQPVDVAEVEIHARLCAELSLSFLRYAIRILGKFVDRTGAIVAVETISDADDSDLSGDRYFGFDGDATGDYLDEAFRSSSNPESMIRLRSRSVREAIRDLGNMVRESSGHKDSVIFAEGDNLFFRCTRNPDLLARMQALYTERTGLSSSIGYGLTPHEASIALRLAKARPGNSVVGVRVTRGDDSDETSCPGLG